ncbi:site-specific integrase [Niallia sp. FSL R7-0648]|uniref:tyrosine-type recombinase/integrase n=1 Tax=Niallia sp. FSL R7-0648 TaxID=2954521 RepID=UPI0030FBE7F4
MTRKKRSLIVEEDLSGLFSGSIVDTKPVSPSNSTPVTRPKRRSIEQALKIITQQMEVSGYRERTISDYNIHVRHFAKATRIQFVEEITAESLYVWLSSMNVSNQTKLTRLKCVKAFLTRCMDNGWITQRFWKTVNVKVDTNVKEGATEHEVGVLLSLLDLNDFVQLRDATAALLMFKTGIRIHTIVHLETKHVDFKTQQLRIDGEIVKNGRQVYLPFGDTLAKMLAVLIKQNEKIKREYKVQNDYVFITNRGTITATSPSNNNIQKRLNKYAKEYGLRNINPHALRRGFAKSLLDKGANIAVISNALGHSDLGVTSRYLHLDKEEVAEKLRRFL